MNEQDNQYLRRCVDLAREAVDNGDEPFGSLLVSASGEVLFEDRNRVSNGDATLHPEYTIVKWAAANMTPEERKAATVYTSGEHCAMCSAAHGIVGLGKIVYASSTEQLVRWSAELGKPSMGIKPLRITEVIQDAVVEGPFEQFSAEIRELHARAVAKSQR